MDDIPLHNTIAPLEQESSFLASQSSPIVLGLAVFLLVLINHAIYIELVVVMHNRYTVPLFEQNKRLLSRLSLYSNIMVLVCSHLVEISIWALALVLAGLVPSFYEAAFFSGSTYTTLGYGKELLPNSWDTITVMIALSGMFSIAWTTSSLINMVGVFHTTRLHTPKNVGR
ncbi:MAG: ion channel [Chthoniobacterales bacterium]